MARLSRLYAPGTIQLVQAKFARTLAADHDPTPVAELERLNTWLHLEAAVPAVALHAWVLMTDRLVLLATPENPSVLPRLVQGMGRRIAAGMVHGRVFEGRYRSALIQSQWLLDCMVWTETLPVQTGAVDTAHQWPWSSARAHIGLAPDTGLLKDHIDYWNLGDTPYARQAQYSERLEAGLPPARRRRIELALHGQWALGDDEFLQELSAKGARRVAPAPRGRPRKLAVTK